MTASRVLLATFFIVAGANHFVSPGAYLAIMPPLLLRPLLLVWISGVAEIAGGAAVLSPVLRRAAGYGLIALLVAVLPANVYAAIHGMSIGQSQMPAWILWARVPLQALLIWWVYRACLRTRDFVPAEAAKRATVSHEC